MQATGPIIMKTAVHEHAEHGQQPFVRLLLRTACAGLGIGMITAIALMLGIFSLMQL